MSDRYDGVLVPAVSPAIIEAFQNYRPQVPLRMSQLEHRLIGIYRYKSGYFRSDYEQLARRMSKLAGAAVVLYFCDEGGSRYQILERTRALREIGPPYDTGEDASEICGVLNASFHEIESLLRNNEGEPIRVNIPLVADAILRIQPEEYVIGHAHLSPRLISQAETVDRLLVKGNPHSAANLLNGLLEQLDLVVKRPARDFARAILEAWQDTLHVP